MYRLYSKFTTRNLSLSCLESGSPSFGHRGNRVGRRAGVVAYLFCVFFVSTATIHAADSTHLRPVPTFVRPLSAPYEARILMMHQPGPGHNRLDIGAEVDILDNVIRTQTDAGIDTAASAEYMRWTFGVDFFTMTRLRSEGNFKFPVETTDFWFGVNGTWTSTATPLSARLRLAHISSHLVDGYADSSGRFVSRLPFVYSREFAEVTVMYDFANVRPYVALTYLWAVQPRIFDRLIPQIGANAQIDLTSALALRAGVDLRWIGIHGHTTMASTAQIGLCTSATASTTVGLDLYRYDGRSIHGMFADLSDHYWGIGASVTF